MYRTPDQRRLELRLFRDAGVGRIRVVAFGRRDLFRDRVDVLLLLQVFPELHVERRVLPGRLEDVLLRGETRDRDGLEHRLELPPDLERFRVGAGRLRHGVLHRSQRFGLPLRVFLRIRVGYRNFVVQGVRLRKLRYRDGGRVFVPDGELVRRRNEGRRRHGRVRRFFRLDLLGGVRMNRRDLLRPEEAGRRLRIFERRVPRLRPFREPLFRLNGFRRHRDRPVGLDVLGREFGKFRELFGI